MIVTAYNRHHFLLDAVKSVATQDLGRDDFEVIISKNFEDPKVEILASNLGFRLLDCGNVSAGGQIASAVEASNGRAIALLDDDDTWSPSRLSHVSKWFLERPSLQYYAHTYQPVDSEGRPDSGRTRARRAHVARLTNGAIESVDPHRQTEESLDRLFRSYPGNNSSIVVSRRLVEKSITDLRKVETSIDHYLLVAGLLESEGMIIERLPLTRWRMHFANTSGIDTSTFSTFMSSLKDRASTVCRDNRVFLEMARRQGNVPLSSFLESKIDLLQDLEILVNGTRSRLGWSQVAWASTRQIVERSESGSWRRALLDARITSAFSSLLTKAALFLYFQRVNSG